MIGSPVIATIVISLLFTLAGITGFSLIKIQPPTEQRERPDDNRSEEGEEVSISFRSAHPLKSLSISYAGEEIPIDKIDNREYDAEFRIKSDFLLTVRAEWFNDAPETALLIHIFPDGGVDYKQTFWAQGSLTEEVSLNQK